MAKIILLVLGLLLAYWILKGYRRRVDRRADYGEGRPPAAGTEDMVRCARCGVHLPRSESVTTQGRFFCSVEHERAHRESGRPG